MLITPRKLELEETRSEVRKFLKASGPSVEDLLEGLKEEREKLHRETYGRKND